jgi:uncharacterized membrane protein (UPF0136 family)
METPLAVDVARYSILLFALMMIAGGYMGYKKAKSKPSLIAGTVSALLLATCYYISVETPRPGFISAFFVVSCLFIVFLARLIKTRKFLPSVIFMTLCVAEQACLLYGFLRQAFH